MTIRSFPTVCVLLVVLWFASCKASEPKETEPDQDTRPLVKAAFQSFDKLKVPAIYNLERAQLIKGQLDKATNPTDRINLGLEFASELTKAGKYKESLNIYKGLMDFIAQNNLPVPAEDRRNLYSLIGVTFLRFGEIENCLQNHNHESCIIPIRGEGVHGLPFGSRNAIVQYEKILTDFPNDLETKYLLNLAYMTLGEYPEKVPAQWRIDPSWFKSKINFPRYNDVAPQLGLNRNGHAGGVITDDFTNDGWIDVVITSWSPNEELIFYVNNGDGTFTDKTAEYGLKGQVGCLNLNQTDFNNDGRLDIYMMRGAWLQANGDVPNTLLMNTGKGFVDVTLKAGLTHHANTQASSWADFNLDGWVDLVVGNESLPNWERGIDLYINQKDGTFKHESSSYGLNLNHFFKGCVATDVNNDRFPDIYFSALDHDNSLFINQGLDGKNSFQDVSASAHVLDPPKSFPCWSFDYDNDGMEDIFVSAYTNDGTPATHWMLSNMGKADPKLLPKLYHNQGNLGFEEVGIQMGLTEVTFTMGCNYGDINTDGFLDFYLSTGNPLYQSLVPNKMYLNMNGKRFEDVSYAGGFANIQKGHGVSFADLDHDGDEDLYVVLGGAFDGDGFFNSLFENPNPDNNNWVVLKLIGTTANRAAIGARVTIYAKENGQEKKFCRTVSSGASFGANSLALEVGLGKATEVSKVVVQWPCKDCAVQEFSGFEINMAYDLTQDSKNPKMVDYTAVKFGGGQAMEHHMHH